MAEAARKADERRERRQRALHEEFGRRFDTIMGPESVEEMMNLNDWFEMVEEKIFQLWTMDMMKIAEMEG